MEDSSRQSKLNLLIEVKCPLWAEESLNYEELFTKWFECVLSYFEPEALIHELSVVLTNDEGIRALNKTYRHQDKATNILSFPQLEDEDDFLKALAAQKPLVLGDLVLAYETFKKEALEQNKSFHDHLAHLFVHGTLHLFGYDHIDEEEAQEMEELEIDILEDLSISNPYTAL